MSEAEKPVAFDPAAMTDTELTESVRENVLAAGHERRHSVYDDRCAALLKEADKREKPTLYVRGYNQACRDAGVRP